MNKQSSRDGRDGADGLVSNAKQRSEPEQTRPIPVEYNTNNSGGSYWLKDKDWKALENAGWKIFAWSDMVYKNGEHIVGKDGLPMKKNELQEGEYDKERFSFTSRDSTTPHNAYKLFNNIQEALEEFERLTGQDVTDEGCNCCGPPHSFTWGKDIIVRLPKERLHEQDYNYASGEDLLAYMYPDKPTALSKRELLERVTTAASTDTKPERT